MLLNEKEQVPSKASQINSESFKGYTAKIKTVFEEMDKMKKAQEAKHRFHVMNSPESIGRQLVCCYNSVPKGFFEESFSPHLIITKLKKRSDVFDFQCNLSDFLDEIQLNLCFQVMTKHQSFWGVFNRLTDLEEKVNTSMGLVREQATRNKEIKRALVAPNHKMMALKQKEINIRRSLQYLELVKSVSKTLPALEELIKKEAYESGYELIKSTEGVYYQRLRELKCFSGITEMFNGAKMRLEKVMVDEFVNQSTDYITLQLAYQIQSGLNESSSPERQRGDETEITGLEMSSFSSLIYEPSPMALSYEAIFGDFVEDKTEPKREFAWSANKLSRDFEFEAKMAKTIVQSLKIRSFSPRVFRIQLNNSMKRQFSNFFLDLFGFLSINQAPEGITTNSILETDSQEPKGNSGSPQQPPIEVDTLPNLLRQSGSSFHLKVVIFLFNLSDLLITRANYFIKKLVSDLILAFDDSLLVPRSPERLAEIQKRKGSDCGKLSKENPFLSELIDVLEEFTQVMGTVLSHSFEKIQDLINMADPSRISMSLFHQFMILYDEMEKKLQKYLKEDLPLRLGTECKTAETQKLISSFNEGLVKLNEEKPLGQRRREFEMAFLNEFHKKSLSVINTSVVEKECWKPVNIPAQFHHIFRYIFFPSLTNHSTLQSTLRYSKSFSSLVSDLLSGESKSAPGSPDAFGKLADLPPGSELKISKSELTVFGKKYVAILSLLVASKLVSDYFFMVHLSRYSRPDCVKFLVNSIQAFSKLSIGMTVFSEATKLGRVQKITVKILSLTAVGLKSLLAMTVKISSFLEQSSIQAEEKEEIKRIMNTSLDDTQNYINQILDKVVWVMTSR